MHAELDWRYREKGFSVIGVDESGRGPLCGPVVVAAVHLLAPIEGLNDSKKLSKRQREALVPLIITHSVWSVYSVLPCVIDEKNILEATLWGMRRVIGKVYPRVPGEKVILVDGNRCPGCFPYEEAIVRGDAQSASIAAASILAKVHRDRIMVRWDRRYPQYGFAAHKGYPTPEHYAALATYGPSPLHRRSFRLAKKPEQTMLF